MSSYKLRHGLIVCFSSNSSSCCLPCFCFICILLTSLLASHATLLSPTESRMKGLFKKDKKEKTETLNAHEYSLGFNLMENILNRPYRHHHPTLPSTSTALVEMQAVSSPSSSAPQLDVNDVMISSLASDFTQMQVGHSGSRPSASTLGHTMATTNPSALEQKPSNKREHSRISSSVRIGEEEAFNNVRDCLTKNEVGMVGIYGMGGVGKTTLMKKVCYEFLKPRNFKVIWIVVSKTVNIQKTLMRELNLNFHEDQDTQARGMCINEALFNSKDKVALLLDDICEALDLEELGVAGGFGLDTSRFKIVFTTRSEDVCLRMDPDQQMKIEWLGPEESWALFKQSVANMRSEVGKLKKLEMVDISTPEVVYRGNIFNECTEVRRLYLKVEDYNFNDLLYNFKKLEELHITIWQKCVTSKSGPFLIEGLKRLTSLKVLTMYGCPIPDGDEVIFAIGAMCQLRELRFTRCSIDKLVIPAAIDFLPQLEMLEIRHCHRLEKVHFEKRALQSLCILEINAGDWLADVVGLQHLLQLREIYFYNLMGFEEGLITTTDDDRHSLLPDVQTHSASFPNLQRLHLQSLWGMKHICNDNVSFPSLSEFRLHHCPMLEKLPRGLMNENKSTPMITGEIAGTEEWWEGLGWEDDAFKSYLLPLFVAVDERRFMINRRPEP